MSSGPSGDVATDAVWSWRATVPASMRGRLRRWTIIWAIGSVGLIAASVLATSRYLIVMTAIEIGIGVVAVLEHRRFLSTRIDIDRAGRITVSDNRSSVTQAAPDSAEFRLRSSHGMRPPSWSLVVGGPDDVVAHRIALVGGFVALDEDVVTALGDEIDHHIGRAGRRVPLPSPTSPESAPETLTDAARRAAAPAPPGRFEWRVPVRSSTLRRRRIFRVVYVVGCLVLAVVAGWSEREGGAGTVILTALAVPGTLFVLMLLGDIAWGRNGRFRLVADAGRLTVHPAWRSAASIALTGSTVSVSTRKVSVSTANGLTQNVYWVVAVEAPDGERLERQFPSFGVATTESDYVHLERELRART